MVCPGPRGVEASESDECTNLEKLPREHNPRDAIRESVWNRAALKEQLCFVIHRRCQVAECKPLWPAKIDVVSLHLTTLLQDRRPDVLHRESVERREHA